MTMTSIQMIPFVINGVSLQVETNFVEMLETIERLKKEWEPGESTELWSTDAGDVKEKDYFRDLDIARDNIKTFQNQPELLQDYVQNVRKKKNGTFWSRSGLTIQFYGSVSEYHTDFTNSWNVLQLRLEVESPNVCRLVLRKKFENQ
ncbi:hypothetical protein ACFYKX_10780 [Cytobacillus sp. FJAT-54145]|uniref:Uncharacterized protein n=1 Tax=Cytobacillus spartinae TaxID=3299023 RepID=A0ABW6KBG8_9BACI